MKGKGSGGLKAGPGNRWFWFLIWLIVGMTPGASGRSNDPVLLTGTVGSLPVRMSLHLDPHTTGSYFYLKRTGESLRLEGTNLNGRIQLAEAPKLRPAQTTGRWAGSFSNSTFAGTWSSADGKKTLTFSLCQVATNAPAGRSPGAPPRPAPSPGTATQAVRASGSPKTPGPAVDRELEEARRLFRCHGQFINPGLVKRFLPWLSDSVPITVEVDLAAGQQSNEFYDHGTASKDGWVVLAQKDEDGGQSSFSYRHLGGMTNGVQVLWVNDWGGGSGVFMSLLFIRFSRGTGNNDGQPYDQLLMRCVGYRNLGDRYRGDVKVLADRVRIFPPPDENEKPAKPVDLRIP